MRDFTLNSARSVDLRLQPESRLYATPLEACSVHSALWVVMPVNTEAQPSVETLGSNYQEPAAA